MESKKLRIKKLKSEIHASFLSKFLPKSLFFDNLVKFEQIVLIQFSATTAQFFYYKTNMQDFTNMQDPANAFWLFSK